MKFFLQGLSLGLAYLTPIGLQNLFVINSALTDKRRRALLTAVIVVFFDITLALACFFGIGAAMAKFRWLQFVILLSGSILVIYIGIGLICSKKKNLELTKAETTIRKTIISACVVTWCNPQAIIDGTMMLGAFHVTLPAGQTVPFISGVSLASFLWFTGITIIISIFKSRFNMKILYFINIACGVVIVLYGIKLMINFIQLF